jgi:hypothetical protein
MLFKPLGDGYSLLCSQKSSFRDTGNYFQSEANTYDSKKIIFEAKLCRGNCFLSYTAEIRHHLTAKIISKEALS